MTDTDKTDQRHSVLRVPGFRVLLIGQTVMWLGSSATSIALVFAMLDTEQGAWGAGLVLAARTVPVVVVGLWGGVIADRTSKRTVVVRASVGSFLCQVCVVWVIGQPEPSLILLLSVTAMLGAVTAVAASSFYALPTDLVPSESLQAAQALLRISRNGTSILGPALGGMVIAGPGPTVVIAVDAGAALIAAVLFLRLPHTPPSRTGGGMVADLRSGWSALIARPWLPISIVAFGLALLGWSAGYSVLGPVHMADTVESAARTWGWVAAALSVGYVVGSLLALRWRPRRPVTHSLIAQACTGVLLVAMLCDWPVPVLIAAAVVAGAAMDQAGVVWSAAMQRHVPKDVLGKVSSYDYVATFGLVPVGYAFAAPLMSATDLRIALAICSALVIVPPFIAAWAPAVRTIEDGRTGPVTSGPE